MKQFTLIATAPFGLESIVAEEVRRLGYENVRVDQGKVEFEGDPEAICRANLWLRTSDRVLIKLAEFPAHTFDELFEGTKLLPWAEWLPADAAFPVEGKSVKSQLSSVPACQGIVKKAIVEKLKMRYKTDWFGETGGRYRVEVSLLKDIATLTLDTTGMGLHKRGYRIRNIEAPVRETLGAAILLLSRWRPDRPLLDPFCGSGTIPIEAALIGLNMAPGLNRNFSCEDWGMIPKMIWEQAREAAQDSVHRDQPLEIVGSDIDPEAVDMSVFHAERAGVKSKITFREQKVQDIQVTQEFGYIICNPPYGERLMETPEVERLYRETGKVFRRIDPSWGFFVLTSYPDFDRLIGRRADKKRKLYNGRIVCNLFQYYPPRFTPRSLDGDVKDLASSITEPVS